MTPSTRAPGAASCCPGCFATTPDRAREEKKRENKKRGEQLPTPSQLLLPVHRPFRRIISSGKARGQPRHLHARTCPELSQCSPTQEYLRVPTSKPAPSPSPSPFPSPPSTPHSPPPIASSIIAFPRHLLLDLPRPASIFLDLPRPTSIYLDAPCNSPRGSLDPYSTDIRRPPGPLP